MCYVEILIETRPEFIQREKYLGSDYFLERVGLLHADQILKRLGDSYVETRLIRSQIFELTGNRYLAGARDDRSLMQALYDNAVDAHQNLSLTIGIARTPSQIAALGGDIIWLERHTIEGQEVLVPRLYLASSTLENLDPSSARIAGSTTIIKAAHVYNSGTISGTEALAIETTNELLNVGGSLLSEGAIGLDVGGQFANRAGTVSGAEVSIAADSLFNSGTIEGAESLGIHTTGELLNEGGSLLSGGDMGVEVGGLFSNLEGTVFAGGAISIAAEGMVNSGTVEGTEWLSIRTTNDLLNEGGSLLSGGDLGIDAGGLFANRSGVVSGGGNVSISATDILNETLVIREENAHGFVDRVDQVATIEAGGSLYLQADNTIRSLGGALRSGGDTTLDAGGDIEIAAVQLESEQRRSGGGGHDNSGSLTHELATIAAGGDLLVSAGGDLAVCGATVEAGGDATLFAVGDTTIESVQDRYWSDSREVNNGRTERSGSRTETQRTTITAGGEITLGSETGDLTLGAVSLKSGGDGDDINLVAEQGTVALLTQTDSERSSTFKREVSTLTWSETTSGRSEQTIEHVEIEPGGELRISAGEGVVVEYQQEGSLAGSLAALGGVPGLAWMGELSGDPSVAWQGVQASSGSWSSSRSGLTAAGRAAKAREEQERAERERQRQLAADAAARGDQDVPTPTLNYEAPGPRSAASRSSDPGDPSGGNGGGDPFRYDSGYPGSDPYGYSSYGVDIPPFDYGSPPPSDGGTQRPPTSSGSGSGGTENSPRSGRGGTNTPPVILETVHLPHRDPEGLGPYGPAVVAVPQPSTPGWPLILPNPIGLSAWGGYGPFGGRFPPSGGLGPFGGVTIPPVGQGHAPDLIPLPGHGQEVTGPDVLSSPAWVGGIGQDLPGTEIPETGEDVIQVGGHHVTIGQDLPDRTNLGGEVPFLFDDPDGELCRYMPSTCPQPGSEPGSSTTGPTIYTHLDTDEQTSQTYIGGDDLPDVPPDGRTVVGKVSDLAPESLLPGEVTLLDRLPDRGTPKDNWDQNSSVLREEMGRGLPIRDASAHLDDDHELVRNSFLRLERNLLREHGWTLDRSTGLWYPP